MAQEAESPTVQQNAYVLVDYTIKVKETDEVVDTTAEEEAKKAGVFDASRTYEPRLVVIGKGMLLKAVEDELVGMKVGERKMFEIPPEKAFGSRDPAKVRTIPLRRFKDAEGPLRVGSVVNVEGREGVVRTVGSGRVQVDFNHYLAGKTLVCSVEVKSILAEDMDRVKSLIHSRIPDAPVEKFEINLAQPTITIKIPEEALLVPGLQVSKRALAKELKEAVKGLEKVVFVEEYA
ncbi:MAG: FKBP-type peptidyl-prolyl cis-trans isomerase [Candidatus Caldarchaeum sp.]|nr:FKBP-type peptidyl-prolyl cis-trans isomerase [Candidatus Caldarchaeum sp.]MDW8359492.1 FKBP-type peptidyl-prolyl cis-trans isomerase [Candidatus Caldarchaeum sp.]